MVLIGPGGQGREDLRIDLGLLGREVRRVSEVHQGLVGVVAHEHRDVVHQAEGLVQLPRVLQLQLVQLGEQRMDEFVHLLALGGRVGFQAALVLVSRVVAVNRLVAQDEPDHVRCVRQGRVNREVQRKVEARVQQQRGQEGRGGLPFERVVPVVVLQDGLRALLEQVVVHRPPVGLVDLRGVGQSREDRRVGAGVDGLHECDVRVDGLLVLGAGVLDLGHLADRRLDRVEHGESGEDSHGEGALLLAHPLPRAQVVGQGDLLGQPEVRGEAVPDLEVLVVGHPIPVDGAQARIRVEPVVGRGHRDVGEGRSGIGRHCRLLFRVSGSGGRGSQGAGHAGLDLGALEGLLTKADVVEALDPRSPGADLRPVDIAGRGRVSEEEGEGESLIDVPRGRGVGVDDLVRADLVGVPEELEVVLGHVGGRVVDAPESSLLADLDGRRDRVDGCGGVVDVADGSRGRHGLEVGVVDAVLGDGLLEFGPIRPCGDRDPGFVEEAGDAFGGGFPFAFEVLVEVGAARVVGLLESLETPPALFRDEVRGSDRVVGDGEEVDVREVDALRAPVVDALGREVAVEVHLPQTDGMGCGVARRDGGDGVDIRPVGHGGQRPHGSFDGGGEVPASHGLGDVERTEVAGDVLAHARVSAGRVVGRGAVGLEDLRAQVRHVDSPGHGIGAVDAVLEHEVRVAGFELEFGEGLEEVPGVDRALADARIGDPFVVVVGDGQVGEGRAVFAFDVVGAEQVHVLVVARQSEGDVGDDDAQGEGLDPYLLVGVLPLGVEEGHDVGVVGAEVDSSGSLTGSELIGVGEGVLEDLHDGDDPGGLVLDALDGGARLAQVGEQKGDAATSFGELEGGVDAAADGFEVVLEAQQEAGDEFAASGLAGVEEGGGGGLESSGDDVVDEPEGEVLVASCEEQGGDDNALLVALEVLLAVEGLERVGGEELEGAEEGAEAVAVGGGAFVSGDEKVPRIGGEDVGLVVAVVDEPVEPVEDGVEALGRGDDLLEEELSGSRAVLVELDGGVGAEDVEFGVERVVVLALSGAGGRRRADRAGHRVPSSLSRSQKRSSPSATFSTSRRVPSSSNR